MPKKLFSFLNNAWSLYVDYQPILSKAYYCRVLDEDGGKWWRFGISSIAISIHQDGDYPRHLMTIMGMMTAGDSRKWKCGATENRLENWSSQHKYGMIRQVQRDIAAALVGLERENDPEGKNWYRCLIEHQIGTLERIRIGEAY